MGFLDFFKPSTSSSAALRKEYEMEKVLGSGTYGEVRLATQKSTGRKVAIKVISKSFLKAHGKTDMVEKEMFVLKLIKHPNIIELITHFETEDKFYLVFPVATGGELFDRIVERKRFTEKDAAIIMATVINAVAYLHDPPHLIVHRDLKPENLLFLTNASDSPLMLVDFGISKVLRTEDELMRTVIGSPGYTAPEVIKRTSYGPKVDMYSCGVIAFTLIAGYSPFYFARDSTAMADAVITGKWKFEAPEWTNVSTNAKDFIKRLMLLNPAKRMSSHEALNHVWLQELCPPGYIEHLQKINDYCMAREYRELPQTAGVPAMVPPIKSVPKSVPSAPIAGEAAQAPSAAEPETVVDKTAYPTKPTDTSEYNSLLSTLDRHQAPDDAPNLLDIHEMAAKTKNSRWRSAASKALLLRSVDLMFQSVHIKKTLSEARSQSSGSLPVVQDSSDDEDESGEKGKARIDRPDSINRKVFKFAPSPEAIAEYEKLMEEEASKDDEAESHQ